MRKYYLCIEYSASILHERFYISLKKRPSVFFLSFLICQEIIFRAFKNKVFRRANLAKKTLNHGCCLLVCAFALLQKEKLKKKLLWKKNEREDRTTLHHWHTGVQLQRCPWRKRTEVHDPELHIKHSLLIAEHEHLETPNLDSPPTVHKPQRRLVKCNFTLCNSKMNITFTNDCQQISPLQPKHHL